MKSHFNWKGIFLLFICILLFFSFPPKLQAVTEQECNQKTDQEKIDCLKQLLSETGQQKASLRSQITKLNTRINLTKAQIDQTVKEIDGLEEEIVKLTFKIARLDISLDELSKILIKRIGETYKKGNIDAFSLLLSSQGFSDFVSRYKYLRVIQVHDRKLLIQMETVRTNYDDQRTLKEQKQTELESAKKKLEAQKALLAQQRKDKEYLLEITENDELRYQNLLAQALAEQESIRQALASLPTLEFTGHVSKGEIIGTQGATGHSTGAHLHFGVYHPSYRWYVDSENPIDQIHSGFLQWPIEPYDRDCYQQIDGRCISQPWGVSEISRALGWYPNDFHDAIDVYAAPGAVIRAAAEGDISYGIDGWGGKYALIKHANDLITTYWHLR